MIEYVKYKPLSYRGRPIDDEIAAVQELDKRHEENYNQMLAIESTMANLDLNEAESEWKSRFISDIKTDLESSISDGDYSKSGEAIKRSARKFATDQGLIGRINYQKQYEDAKQKVMNDPNIDADTKRYWLSQNQYAYKDITDDSGKVVGGSSFTPTVLAKDFDFNKLFIDAAKTTASTTTNVGGVKREVKKADDILKTSLAFIENNPEAKARINQDYAIQLDKAERGEANNITDKNGVIMSFESYVKSRALDTANAAAYTNIDTSAKEAIARDQANRNMQMRLKMMELESKGKGKDGSGTKSKSGNPMQSVVTTGFEPVKINDYQTAYSNKQTSVNAINNIARKYNIPANVNFTVTVNDVIKSISNDTTLSDEMKKLEKNKVRNLDLDARNNQQLMNDLKSTLSASDKQWFDIQDAMDNGDLNLIDDSNPKKKELVNTMNLAFRDHNGKTYNGASFKFDKLNTNNQKLIEELKTNFGEDGIKITSSNDGNTIVTINKDAAFSNITQFSRLYESEEFKGLTPIFIGEGDVITNNGNRKKVSESFKSINSSINSAFESLESNANYNVVPLTGMTISPNEYLGDYTGKQIDDNIKTIIKTTDFSNVPIKIRKDTDNKGIYTDISDDEKSKYIELINNNIDKNVDILYTSDKNKFIVNVREPLESKYRNKEDIIETDKSYKTTQFVVDLSGRIKEDDLVNQVYENRAWKNNSRFNKAENQVNDNIIAEYYTPQGITSVNIKHDTEGFKINGVKVTKAEAIAFKNATEDFNQAMITISTLSEEDAKKLIVKISNDMTSYKTGSDKKVAKDYIANLLMDAYNKPNKQ